MKHFIVRSVGRILTDTAFKIFNIELTEGNGNPCEIFQENNTCLVELDEY